MKRLLNLLAIIIILAFNKISAVENITYIEMSKNINFSNEEINDVIRNTYNIPIDNTITLKGDYSLEIVATYKLEAMIVDPNNNIISNYPVYLSVVEGIERHNLKPSINHYNNKTESTSYIKWFYFILIILINIFIKIISVNIKQFISKKAIILNTII